jgi:hypothetical protein
MASTKEQSESTSAYFRRVFEENPDWLAPGNNQAVIERWQTDHPGETLTPNMKNIMSNVKSQMNKALGRRGQRRRRRKEWAEATADRDEVAVPWTHPSLEALEDLESRIDECLAIARSQEVEGFDDIIRHLRQARNGVVWAIGQPAFES